MAKGKEPTMKLTNLFWVLALAGATAACNSGPAVDGCGPGATVNASGLCEAIGGTGGAGGGGMGGAGGMAECATSDFCQNLTGGTLFDFSGSVFKPYSSLLDETTGTGDFRTDCAAPDLSNNPGANLTNIAAKCVLINPPGVCGCMQFDETSPGSGIYDVTGEQTLEFVIDVTITSVAAQVVITTNSVTTFTGTGSGALPGMITMEPLTAPFDVNAAAIGKVNCKATSTGNGADISDAVCPLANLMGGDNSVPLPGDPGQRTFPPITVGADTFELGSGPADPTGWYLSNPAPLAGNGTQWVALAGALEDGGGGGGGGGTGGTGGAGGAGGGG